MNLLMDLMWGVREKTASFLTHWKDGVRSLFIKMWKTAGKCLGGKSGVWFLVQEMSSRQLYRRALGATDWKEISP